MYFSEWENRVRLLIILTFWMPDDSSSLVTLKAPGASIHGTQGFAYFLQIGLHF